MPPSTIRPRAKLATKLSTALAASSMFCLVGCANQAALSRGPQSPAASSLHVAFLLLDGVYGSELIAPHDVFHHLRYHAKGADGRSPLDVFTVGRSHDEVTSFEGLRIRPDYALDDAPRIDLLVVPSALHNLDSDLEDSRLIAWVKQRGRSCKRLLSLCDGAFVLAQAGLLDGRRCTTFPDDIPALRRRFPELDVTADANIVVDGPCVSSGGGAKSYDAALLVVDEMYGAKAAEGIARGLLIDWSKEAVAVEYTSDKSPDKGASSPTCWQPGEVVDGKVTVQDSAGKSIKLADIAAKKPCKGIAFYIVAGAEGGNTRKRGGLWCEDSFSDLPLLRHLKLDYEKRGIRFIAVLCPPVYHEANFAYDQGSFLTRSDDDPVYKKNRALFVQRSLALAANDVLPFEEIYFDPRFRLLANPERGAASVGERPAWQGRFKWSEDTQTYGTPCLWILDADLRVFGKPFYMNVYESEGRLLRYSARDVGSRLDRLLEEAARK